MQIRNATINEIEAITTVESQCYPEAEAATKHNFRERLIIMQIIILMYKKDVYEGGYQ